MTSINFVWHCFDLSGNRTPDHPHGKMTLSRLIHGDRSLPPEPEGEGYEGSRQVALRVWPRIEAVLCIRPKRHTCRCLRSDAYYWRHFIMSRHVLWVGGVLLTSGIVGKCHLAPGNTWVLHFIYLCAWLSYRVSPS